MRHKTLAVCTATIGVGLLLPIPWRGATLRAVPQAGTTAVRPAPTGQRFGGQPGVRGATYYAFEGQAVRVTTEFGDATVTARRGFEGDVEAIVHERSGAEVARLKVDSIDTGTSVLRYTPADGLPLQAYGQPSTRLTLDWANRQAYALWRDTPDSVNALEWRGDLMRRKGAAKDDFAANAVALETEWPNGLSARSARRSVKPYEPIKGHAVDGNLLVTHLYQHGTDVGTMNWFSGAGLLVWDLSGLTRGYIAPEHLKDFGGWPFAPDMTWMNIQVAAFHHFKSLIKSQGFVARSEPGWPARLAQFFVPTVHANEPGCDDLHWLDGTIYRFCCDVHDYCFEKAGCTSSSWWRWWSSWTCDACNAWVVICFLTGADTFPNTGMVK